MSTILPFAAIGAIGLTLFMFVLQKGSDSTGKQSQPTLTNTSGHQTTNGNKERENLTPEDQQHESRDPSRSRDEKQQPLPPLPEFQSPPNQYPESEKMYSKLARNIAIHLLLKNDPSAILFRVNSADRIPVLLKAFHHARTEFHRNPFLTPIHCCKYPPQGIHSTTPLPILEALSKYVRTANLDPHARIQILHRIRKRLQKLELSQYDEDLISPFTQPDQFLALKSSIVHTFRDLFKIQKGQFSNRKNGPYAARIQHLAGRIIQNQLLHSTAEQSTDGSLAATLLYLEAVSESNLRHRRDLYKQVRQQLQYRQNNPSPALLPYPKLAKILYAFPRTQSHVKTMKSLFEDSIKTGDIDQQRIIAFISGLPGWPASARRTFRQMFTSMVDRIHPDQIENPEGLVQSTLLYAALQNNRSLYNSIRSKRLLSYLSDTPKFLTFVLEQFGDIPLLQSRFIERLPGDSINTPSRKQDDQTRVQKNEDKDSKSGDTTPDDTRTIHISALYHSYYPQKALDQATQIIESKQPLPNTRRLRMILWSYLRYAPRPKLPMLYSWYFENENHQLLSPRRIALDAMQTGKFPENQVKSVLTHVMQNPAGEKRKQADRNRLFDRARNHPLLKQIRTWLIVHSVQNRVPFISLWEPDEKTLSPHKQHVPVHEYQLFLLDGLLRCCPDQAQNLILKNRNIQVSLATYPKKTGELLFRHGAFHLGLSLSSKKPVKQHQQQLLRPLFDPALNYRVRILHRMNNQTINPEKIDFHRETSRWMSSALRWSIWGNWLFDEALDNHKLSPYFPNHILLNRKEARQLFKKPSSSISLQSDISQQLYHDRNILVRIVRRIPDQPENRIEFGAVRSPDAKQFAPGSTYPGLNPEITRKTALYPGYQFLLQSKHIRISFKADLVRVNDRWKAFRLRNLKMKQ